MLGELLLKPFEITLNTLLRTDECFFPQLKPFTGRIFRLRSRDNWWQIDCVIKENAIFVYPDAGAKPDVTVSLTPAFIKEWLLDPKNPAVFFSNQYDMQGDSEFAEQLKSVFAAFEFDLETCLSGVLGDTAAHHVSYGVRETHQYLRRTTQACQEQMRDYLQEETEWLVPKCLVDEFIAETQVLRADVDRLEARLNQLTAARQTVATNKDV